LIFANTNNLLESEKIVEISFAIDGRQYIAVTAGLGGGSPRRIPSLLAREVRYPETGNALYVFKLRDRR
jgi:alcohol dehydrogenase (cytochrome c)